MTLEEMIEHSFRNFHVKGFDYLCIKRTEHHTRKVYFFDGDVAHLPEVVNPHDHRYNFRTTILTGVMSNSLYTKSTTFGRTYQEFEWNTPLNGGDGFTWKRQTRLLERTRTLYEPGATYHMKAEEFHTIRMHADQTVIVLDQLADVVPIGTPTLTFMEDHQAPSLDGLYEKFTADQLLERLRQYQELTS